MYLCKLIDLVQDASSHTPNAFKWFIVDFLDSFKYQINLCSSCSVYITQYMTTIVFFAVLSAYNLKKCFDKQLWFAKENNQLLGS